jgi:L-serine/L-threonine ammonia-lyase
MEAFQPVGSFKLRGIGRACRVRVERGAARLLASSGGNAGFAVAYAGRRLGVPVTVLVPKTTPEAMRARIRSEQATVIEHGDSWDDAHDRALELSRETGVAYIHPFDDPEIWAGHSTLIDEIASLEPAPQALVVSVGGGGLLCGVLEGMRRANWDDVPLLAVETEGAASFAASVAAGRLVTLERIDSIAVTLGARTVAAEALAWAGRHPVIPWIVDDRAAVDACARFAEDHRVLVEPACGAALAAVYRRADALAGLDPVVVVVCGGASASPKLLESWQRQVGLAPAS